MFNKSIPHRSRSIWSLRWDFCKANVKYRIQELCQQTPLATSSTVALISYARKLLDMISAPSAPFQPRKPLWGREGCFSKPDAVKTCQWFLKHFKPSAPLSQVQGVAKMHETVKRSDAPKPCTLIFITFPPLLSPWSCAFEQSVSS